MSKILEVHITSAKLQEEMQNFVGKDNLYGDVNELVCVALRYFFDEKGYQSKEDTREAFYAHELSDELMAELEKGWGERNPELDYLMEEGNKSDKE